MGLIKKIAIVDDENEYVVELNTFIQKFFNENDLSCQIDRYDSAGKFLDKYDYSYEMVFMDINLPGINGMTAVQELRKIDKDVMVIFVTSLAQYALKGYEVDAFDFVVKPINYFDFALKLERALPYLRQEKDKSILINNKQTIRKINVSEIVYIEITEHRLAFHLSNGEIILTYGTLKTYIELLKEYPFALCNQCYFINLKYVIGVEDNQVNLGEVRLQISRPKRKEFIRVLNDYISNGG